MVLVPLPVRNISSFPGSHFHHFRGGLTSFQISLRSFWVFSSANSPGAGLAGPCLQLGGVVRLWGHPCPHRPAPFPSSLADTGRVRDAVHPSSPPNSLSCTAKEGRGEELGHLSCTMVSNLLQCSPEGTSPVSPASHSTQSLPMGSSPLAPPPALVLDHSHRAKPPASSQNVLPHQILQLCAGGQWWHSVPSPRHFAPPFCSWAMGSAEG